MLTDPISDLLTRVRNASEARHKRVDVPASQTKVAIVDLWKKGGFIKSYRLYRQDDKGVVRIFLKYYGKNSPVIQGLKRVSTPGRRKYVAYSKLPKVLGGLGQAVISSSKGIVSDETARELKVGGEWICSIW